MSWVSAALIGASAGAGYLSSRSKNKKLPKYEPKPYSGYKPPHVEFLRPVEKQITDIVMRRSQGQDVGFDPERRNQLQEIYDTDFNRRAAREDEDINNRISGMGLSRNVAATQALLGRAKADREADRSIYQKSINVEDLTRRNEERDANTGRLQMLNSMNFGQENNVANFDRAVWEAEQGNEQASAGIQQRNADMYEDPFAAGVGSAVNTGLGMYALGGMGTNTGTSTPDFSRMTSPTSQYYGGAPDPTTYALMVAARRGKNLRA